MGKHVDFRVSNSSHKTPREARSSSLFCSAKIHSLDVAKVDHNEADTLPQTNMEADMVFFLDGNVLVPFVKLRLYLAVYRA